MAVERIDYYSEEEYQIALQMEQDQEQQWREEQAEAQYLAEQEALKEEKG